MLTVGVGQRHRNNNFTGKCSFIEETNSEQLIALI